eukprot:gene18595-6039_t
MGYSIDEAVTLIMCLTLCSAMPSTTLEHRRKACRVVIEFRTTLDTVFRHALDDPGTQKESL